MINLLELEQGRQRQQSIPEQKARQILLGEQEPTVKWYKGSQPTNSEIAARIYTIGQTDKAKAGQLWNAFQVFQQDPSTPCYNPYTKSTNKAVQELQALGFDMGKGVTQNWLNENSWLKNYYRIENGTTPLAPSKTSTPEQNAAYWYYKLLTAEDTTRKAETEWKALQEEIRYWTGRKDRNYSDDEILAKIDWSNYKTLAGMDEDRLNGLPTTLNRAVGYSQDALRGVIWAARNGSTGDPFLDSVQSALGAGAGWQDDPKTRAKLDPSDPAYSPYSVGSTIDDAALYFGLPEFDAGWTDRNQAMANSSDLTQRKYYQQVYDAEQTTRKAEEELQKLWSDIDAIMKRSSDPDYILKTYLDENERQTLTKLDQSRKNGKGLVGTTRAIDYRWEDVEAEVRRRCDIKKNAEKGSRFAGELSASLAAPGNGPAPDSSIQKAKEDAIQAAVPTIEAVGTAEDKIVFETAYSANPKEFSTQIAKAINTGNIPQQLALAMINEHVNKYAAENYFDAAAAMVPYQKLEDELKNLKSQREPIVSALDNYAEVMSIPQTQWTMLDVGGRLYHVSAEFNRATGEYLITGVQDEATGKSITPVQAKPSPRGTGVYSDDGEEEISLSPAGAIKPSGKAAASSADGEEDISMAALEGLDSGAVMDAVNQWRKSLPSVSKEKIDSYDRLNNAEAFTEAFQQAEELANLITDREAQLEAAKPAYDKGAETMKQIEDQYSDMYALAGLNSEEAETRSLLPVLKYAFAVGNDPQPTVWESYSAYDVAEQYGLPAEEIQTYAIQTRKTAQENIADIDYVISTLEQFGGGGKRDDILDGLKRERDRLEREAQTADYYMLRGQKDFKAVANVEAGAIRDSWNSPETSELDRQAVDPMTAADRDVLTYMPALTQEERDTYLYIRATQGADAAQAYYAFLTNDSYGIIHRRTSERIEQFAKEFGEGSPWLALGVSGLLSLGEVAGSLYTLKTMFTGEELNPYNSSFGAATFKETSRASAREEVENRLGVEDGTIGALVFDIGYEAIMNRYDSFVNSLLAPGAGLFKGFKIGENLVGAMPMGLSAAASAARRAKIKGATDEQAYLIFGVNFVAETATEAITYGNIKDAFSRGGEKQVISSLKQLAKNALGDMFEEAGGEMAAEAIEQIADKEILQKLSEYESNVDAYIASGIPREKAEEMARYDIVGSIVYAGVVAMVSSGASSMVADTLNGNYADAVRLQRQASRQGVNPDSLADQINNLNKTLVALNKARSTADTASKTETIAGVLGQNSDSPDAADTALAAASHMVSKFGGDKTINALARSLVIAANNGMNSDSVSIAMTIGALADGEASSALTDIMENGATPGRLDALARAAANDQQNEAVMAQAQATLQENKTALEEAQIIADGGADAILPYQDRLDQAKANQQKAQNDLDAAQQALADADATRSSLYNQLAEDTMNDKLMGELNTAVERMTGAQAVVQEYQQALAKAQNAVQTAQAELERVRNSTKKDIAAEAEQRVAQADQQRQEQRAAVQQAEQEQASAKAEQQETEDVATLEANSFITDVLNGDVTEEERQKVIEMARRLRAEAGMEATQRRYRYAKEISKKYGVNIVFEDTTHGGTVTRQNGFYDRRSNRIVLDNSATVSDVMYAVLAHELTHVAERSGLYDDMATALLRIKYGNNVGSYRGFLSEIEKGITRTQAAMDVFGMQSFYNTRLEAMHAQDESIDATPLTTEEAAQELLADIMGDILGGDQALISQLAAEEPGLARRILDTIKSFLKKMAGVEGPWKSDAQKVVEMLETALKDVQKTDNNGERKYSLKDINNLTRDQEYGILVGVQNGQYRNGTYIPLRRSTPSILISQISQYTNGETIIEDRPIIADVGHLRQTMDSKDGSSYNPNHVPHDIGPDEMLSIIEGMDDPAYIIQQKNGRYAEVIRYYDGKKKHAAYAVFDFGDNRDENYLNGYPGGTYNTMVTVFDPDSLQQYINSNGNVIVYDKTKSALSGGSDRLWSSHTETAPFADASVARAEESVKPIAENSSGTPLASELRGGTVTKDYSLSSWTEEEKTKTRNALIKRGFAEADVDKWISDTNSVAAIIASDRQRLDFQADETKSMVKPNTEYGASIDASTLCAKRLLYQGTFDEIQHLLPNTPLMPEDLIDLANMMREMGYETPCGICYVESRRRNLGKEASKWLEKYTGEYKPRLEEVTTTDGLEALRKSHPQAYNDFMEAMKNLGQRNPKVVQLRTDYRGEIRGMTDKAVQKAINHGGFRIQSFSDFEVPHLLDMMQVVLDMSSKGLTSQAYTKVPAFAWVFGGTGIKINLSLIGKGTGLDENGNLVFDDIEGMPFEEAMRIRDQYSQNVGTILVGINDAQILAAMADDRIDFIIPFHRSGWSNEELAKMPVLNNYSDYQNDQNEKKIIGKKANGKGYETMPGAESRLKNFEPVGENGYWDFSKSGKENAETYLRMCAEDGRVPKFSQFLIDNGDGSFSLKPDGSTDGYWKTLIDFKMYDNDGVGSPQLAVKPNINMEEAQRVLNEYSLDRNGITRENNNALPVAQPVVERYVEEYKEKHPRVQYSLQRDQEYEAAVAAGDMTAAQKLVDETAEAAGYDTGYVAWRGDSSPYNILKTGSELDEENDAEYNDDHGNLGDGLYFTPDMNYARQFAGRNGVLRKFYLKASMADLDAPDVRALRKAIKEDIEDELGDFSRDELYQRLMDETGTNGIKATGVGGLSAGARESIVQESWQAKLADPVTYDDTGNVIPLSERFNTESPDIRYSLTPVAPVSPSTYAWQRGATYDEVKEAHPSLYDLTADENETRNPTQVTVTTKTYRKIYEMLQKEGFSGSILDASSGLGIGTDVGRKEFGYAVEDIEPYPDKSYTPMYTDYSALDKTYDVIISNAVLNVIPQDLRDALTVKMGEMLNPGGRMFVNVRGTDVRNAKSKVPINENQMEYFIADGASYQKGFKPQELKAYLEDALGPGFTVETSKQFGQVSAIVTKDENYQTPNVRYSLPSDKVLEAQLREYLFSGLPPRNNTGEPPAQRQRQFGAQTAQRSEALHQEVRDFLRAHSAYDPETNRGQIDRAVSWVAGHATAADPDGYYGAMAEAQGMGLDAMTADGQARMLTLMAMASMRNDVSSEVALAQQYNEQGTAIGRALQSRRIFAMMSPLGRVATLQKLADQINQENGKKTGRRPIRLSPELLDAAGRASTPEEFDAVRRQACQEIAAQMPANWKEKLRSWRMLSMLGNPRTHVRNILGNAVFIPAVKLKNVIAAGLEAATQGAHPGEMRTKSLYASKENRQFAQEDAAAIRDTLTGEGKFNPESEIERLRASFGTGRGILSRTLGKGLQAVSDANSWALEAEDWIFLRHHYVTALSQWMQANKITPDMMRNDQNLLDRGREYAINEAQKATYRDASEFASLLSRIGAQDTWYGWVINAVLPFKKTPANILKRGIEYSPVGLIRALSTDLYHLHQYNQYARGELEVLPDKAISPTQWIDRLAAGLSGTAIAALGAFLSHMGVVTVGLDDKEDELDKAEGRQEYAINFSIGGEDYSYTIDWAAPVCMPFFVGASIYEALTDEGKELDIGGVVDSILEITEPVFNLSMLDGVNSLLNVSTWGEGNAITQIGEKVATNYATSYVPTLLGQFSRTIDPTRRKAYVESGASLSTFRYAIEQMQNKTPYSVSNIPYRNVWGEEDRSTELLAALENFLSPGYISKVEESPVEAELRRLYQTTGDSNAIPKTAGKTITAAGETIRLNAEQYDQLVLARGETAMSVLSGLLDQPLYQSSDDFDRLKMVDDAWTYVNQTAKAKIADGTKIDKWVAEAEESGDPVQAIIGRREAAAKADYIAGHKQSMLDSIGDGNINDAMTSIEALKESGKDSSWIRSAVTTEYKPRYLEAVSAGDDGTVMEIQFTLMELGLGYKKSDFTSWVKNQAKKDEE